jgi:anthranilate phosphoribosyltransferase
MQQIINYRAELSSIIKRKAIGPSGSRHLKEEDLQTIIPALESDDVDLVSKAVLVTAVIILDRNSSEDRLLNQWKSGKQFLPDELRILFFEDRDSDFHSILQKILQGKDLNAEEASAGIEYLLDPNIPDYQKGVFLIGERLKRENFEENAIFLQTMQERANSCLVNVPVLIDLSDPYDGFRRYPIYTPFAAALLGTMGFPAYCHGLQKVAPKNGHTIHKILDLAGKNPSKSIDVVAEGIENEEIGWGYVDQSIYFPALNNLINLRQEIVKRPFLATLEKLVQPLQSPKSNFLVAGFVHIDYKRKLAKLLKSRPSVDAALIVKGMEGSTQIDFRKKPEAMTVQNGGIYEDEAETDQINYSKEEWKQQRHSLAEYTLETGISALKGKKNTARKILVNQVVQIIRGFQISEAVGVRLEAEKMLDSGSAFRHWQRGCN